VIQNPPPLHYTLDFRRRWLGRYLPPGPGVFRIGDRTVPLNEVRVAVDGKTGVVLICGYNSSSDAAAASYARILAGLKSAGVEYDFVFCVQWPTSRGPGYWLAEAKVYWDGIFSGFGWWEGMGNRLGAMMRSLPFASVDFIAHSLGNAAVLDALPVPGARNLFLTNAAVPANALSFGGGRFMGAVQTITGRAVVFFSLRDDVLRVAFRAAHFGAEALGYVGTVGQTPPQVMLVDATDWCAGHSGCRDAAEYYQQIKATVDTGRV
jgi:hypothetical protein